MAKPSKSERKAQLGQFLTPATTAKFMASLFVSDKTDTLRLLDPGAGTGSLTRAFLDRCASGDLAFHRIEVTTYEIDGLLHEDLNRVLAEYERRLPLTYDVRGCDFVQDAVKLILATRGLWGGEPGYTHAILNPPYRKIRGDSHYRHDLRRVGIETVNLYSAFLALTLELMVPGGQIVAIIPRSFCNGPYYLPFRELLLQRAAIRQMHLFGSRDKAFKGDGVLQENVIVVLERDGAQGDVVVSTSHDDTLHDLTAHSYSFERIVSPRAAGLFIHIPTSPHVSNSDLCLTHSLIDLGIGVSTGPVVDFRLKEHLREMPGEGAVPLLYPAHFTRGTLDWPKAGGKKPNAILRNAETERWLYPTGCYCVVRRFSSKEERRRVVPSVIEPCNFAGATALGLENHLNVFHEDRHGLLREVAYGLSVYLQSTRVDDDFRSFSGHTQVNATDLKLMSYPSREELIALGKWRLAQEAPSQGMIDEALNRVCG